MPTTEEEKLTLKDLPSLVDQIMGRDAGEDGKEDKRTLEEKIKAAGVDDAGLEKIKQLAMSFIGNDLNKMPKELAEKYRAELKKNEDLIRNQLYETIKHQKDVNKEVLDELNKLKQERLDEQKRLKDEEEKRRQETLTTDQKVIELRDTMTTELKKIHETYSAETTELKKQLHIRDMEKLRDTLVLGKDIIAEFIPPITAETTQESLTAAVETAIERTEFYREKFGAKKKDDDEDDDTSGAGNGQLQNKDKGGILLNGKGGRAASDDRKLQELMAKVEKATSVTELESLMAQVAELQKPKK